MDYKVVNKDPIVLSDCSLSIRDLLAAINETNNIFDELYAKTKLMDLNLFSFLDFRVLSGLVGESFISKLSSTSKHLAKNPCLDGYPDLLQIATKRMREYFLRCTNKDFIKYKYGGLEVKNTFGTKRANSFLINGEQRIEYINKKLDWKAHHQKTNHLIALLSDFVDAIPKIVAVFYSDKLVPNDWAKVQRPKVGSAMTSFSTISSTGLKKLKSGLKICFDDEKYLAYVQSIG
jgi:hypothetical protein